jgi:hypothetical protein
MFDYLPDSMADFFGRLPDLFNEANQRQWDVYEETLFTMQRPVTHGNVHAVRRYIGGYNPPKQALADERVDGRLNEVLAQAKYPDAGALSLLDPYTEGSSEFAAALLHFNNPAYPLYDAATVGGLHLVGFDHVRYVSTIEGDTVDEYQKYVEAIQELKVAAPYQAVPEKPYYLTRIIQEGLWMVGLEDPAPEARNRPRPTLR